MIKRIELFHITFLLFLFSVSTYSAKNEELYFDNYNIDDGTLTIAKASTKSFTVLDKYRVIKGQDAWGPIAIADGYLLMRDSKQMVCLDMKVN